MWFNKPPSIEEQLVEKLVTSLQEKVAKWNSDGLSVWLVGEPKTLIIQVDGKLQEATLKDSKWEHKEIILTKASMKRLETARLNHIKERSMRLLEKLLD